MEPMDKLVLNRLAERVFSPARLLTIIAGYAAA